MDLKKDSNEYQLEYTLGYLVGALDRILFSKIKDTAKINEIRKIVDEQKKAMGIKK